MISLVKDSDTLLFVVYPEKDTHERSLVHANPRIGQGVNLEC